MQKGEVTVKLSVTNGSVTGVATWNGLTDDGRPFVYRRTIAGTDRYACTEILREIALSIYVQTPRTSRKRSRTSLCISSKLSVSWSLISREMSRTVTNTSSRTSSDVRWVGGFGVGGSALRLFARSGQARSNSRRNLSSGNCASRGGVIDRLDQVPRTLFVRGLRLKLSERATLKIGRAHVDQVRADDGPIKCLGQCARLEIQPRRSLIVWGYADDAELRRGELLCDLAAPACSGGDVSR
jgi:hypothetical protein